MNRLKFSHYNIDRSTKYLYYLYKDLRKSDLLVRMRKFIFAQDSHFPYLKGPIPSLKKIDIRKGTKKW